MQKQQGFTLIELVMVIVILGTLAAVALPKFADLSRQARIATLKAAHGAVISAMNIVHSQAVIESKESLASSTISVEGETITIVYGYPAVGNNTTSSIRTAAGLDSVEFVVSAIFNGNADTGLVLILPGPSVSSSCGFQYSNATITSPPIVGEFTTVPFLMALMCK